MAVSIFDLFTIGIGPSSSHTVGPMRAALGFARDLRETPGVAAEVASITVTLYGSLGATGRGHGTDKAVVLGLEGQTPETVDITLASRRLARLAEEKTISLAGGPVLPFDPRCHLVFEKRKRLPGHPNGMSFCAQSRDGREVLRRAYFSVGGGFIVQADADGKPMLVDDSTEQPYSFASAEELLAHCRREALPISQLMLANERAWRSDEETCRKLMVIWQAMQACVTRGCEQDGVLPGLKVPRRAPGLFRQLATDSLPAEPLAVLDWVSLYAIAVNEENAAGGRVVTAPTNGAAGIIPAVLHYYTRFCANANDSGVIDFLLTAGAIGLLFKRNASISGAEVGCQGEVGSACAMAAAGLTEVLGGTPAQVENAAEIAMEHNLGLTCDPIGGLVQIPCIERNAVAAVKAINASRMALRGDGTHFVTLDKVIRTMLETGRDMHDKYKETSRGGLATNVLEIPVNWVEC